MAYKNRLVGCFKISELWKSRKRFYDFSYEKRVNIFYKNTEDIAKYIEDNYINKTSINMEHLLNDLTLFKTAKVELELKIRKNELFADLISDILTLFVAFSAISIATKNKVLIFKSARDLVFLLFFVIVNYITSTTKRPYYGKLETINNVISVLEIIKEDIYFQKEKESKEDECRYRVDLLNSLNSFKENKSDKVLDSKKMLENKSLALNFTKEENENSLVNKASKISFLILFLLRMKKRMNDKK